MGTLTVRSGPGQGQTIEIDREIVIGREGADLTIADPQISRRHAVVRPAGDGVLVEDLGSTNGTSVSGQRIDGVVTVTSSVTIEIGDSVIDLELPEPPAATRVGATALAGDVRVPGAELERTLRVIWGPAAGRSLTVDDEIVIGREQADLTILDPELSRRHAAIKPVPGGVALEDLGSTNGTYLNGERITEPVTVTTSANLRVGTTEIEIELRMPGATRVGAGLPEARDPSGISAFNPQAAVALRLAQAEAVEAEVEGPGAEAEASPASPLPGFAARFGITERNRRWWILAAMCSAMAMASLDTTVINVALPSIQDDLDIGIAGLEWTVNGFALTLAVLLVSAGRMGDLYGRRRMFLVGMVIFAIASVVAGAAPNAVSLIGSRALQGVGAALMLPATLSILTHAFPPAQQSRAIGLWAGVGGIALALGPVVGGLLTEQVSWRAVFYINVPIVIAGLLVTLAAVPESRDEESERGLDIAGNATLSLSLTALLVGLIQAPSWGWTSTITIALFAGSLLGLGAFVRIETRARVPMIDFRALKAPQFISANLAGFAVFFLVLAALVYLAIYMQSVLGYDALDTGIRFLPGTALIVVAAPLAGVLVDRVNPRYLIASGLVLTAVGTLLLTRITADTGYGLVAAALAFIGVGMGLSITPMSASAVAVVRREKAGMASGVLVMMRQLGAAFGVAIVGSLFQSLTRSNITDNLAGTPLTDSQKTAIGDAALHGSTPPGAEALDPALAAQVSRGATSGLVDALASAYWVPAILVLAGAVAVIVMVERRGAEPAAATEPLPVAH